MIDDFDFAPTLKSNHLRLEPLRPTHFDSLLAAASDPEIWAGHPAKDRYQPDAFRTYFDLLIEKGGTLVVSDASSSELIGCSRFYIADDQPDAVSIGFTFLTRPYWGGNWNFELKRLMLEHAFKTVDTVWFHIDPTNIRSQKATAKLGAIHGYDKSLMLGDKPAQWMCYKLEKSAWHRACEAQSQT